MEAKEVEKQSAKTTLQLQNLKTKLKKWWLLPTMAVLIVVPMILVLTYPKEKKPLAPTPVIENVFTYHPLTAAEFEVTVDHYSAIKQPYIADFTKRISIYLTGEEWDSLNFQNFAIASDTVTSKIVNNLSNNLRLIGLIAPDKGLDLENAELVVNLERKTDQEIAFSGNLKYGDEGKTSLLPIGGSLKLSQEIIPPLTVVNNETMPQLLEELKNNDDLKNSIGWNSSGFWYGLETIGEKVGPNNQWQGDQKVDLKTFNNVALAWFLDTLKVANLITYDYKFQAEKTNLYVNGWNPANLGLNHKDGLTTTSDYAILTDDNWPWDNNTNKPKSIVAKIEFGWKNPLNNEITTVDSTGSYIISPVWDYYVQA